MLRMPFRVSEHETHNKMGLKNLATVFGPTLLRPAPRNSQPKTMEQLFCLAAHETAVQTTAIYQLLLMKCKGVQFEKTPTTNCWTSTAISLFLCTPGGTLPLHFGCGLKVRTFALPVGPYLCTPGGTLTFPFQMGPWPFFGAYENASTEKASTNARRRKVQVWKNEVWLSWGGKCKYKQYVQVKSSTITHRLY